MSRSELAARTTIVLAIVLAPVIFWYMFDVILVAIGALLLALVLRLVASQISRWTRLPESLALLLAGLLMIGVFGGALYLFGTRVSGEFADVLRRAQLTQHTIEKKLNDIPLGHYFMTHMTGSGFSLTSVAGYVFMSGAGLLEAVVAAVVAGAYVAANPSVYRTGLVQLFPKASRRRAAETVDTVERGLQLWLLGQAIQMVVIGLMSGVAVWLIGLPSPIALGLIAALAEFIPYVGPIIAALPALLVAGTENYTAVAWTLGAYLLIHQTEGNLLAPMIQQRMVTIPPGIMLLGIITVSFAFGLSGMIFAAPLSIITFVLIKKIYVRDTLGDETPLPGDPKAASETAEAADHIG